MNLKKRQNYKSSMRISRGKLSTRPNDINGNILCEEHMFRVSELFKRSVEIGMVLRTHPLA